MVASEEHARIMKSILELKSEPVAVWLVNSSVVPESFSTWEQLSSHRYCQALMRARQGESVILDGDGLSCPAAAAAFGFKPLPEGLANGHGLVGFGIVPEPNTGVTMFQGMTNLSPHSIHTIAVSPLAKSPSLPDIIVVEGEPEQLMWLLLADQNLDGGKRRAGDTAVLQATCVDCTIIPYVEQRMNFTLGCYGCREATDLATSEAALGFPGSRLEGIIEQLILLEKKAMPRSRSKNVYSRLASKTIASPFADGAE